MFYPFLPWLWVFVELFEPSPAFVQRMQKQLARDLKRTFTPTQLNQLSLREPSFDAEHPSLLHLRGDSAWVSLELALVDTVYSPFRLAWYAEGYPPLEALKAKKLPPNTQFFWPDLPRISGTQAIWNNLAKQDSLNFDYRQFDFEISYKPTQDRDLFLVFEMEEVQDTAGFKALLDLLNTVDAVDSLPTYLIRGDGGFIYPNPSNGYLDWLFYHPRILNFEPKLLIFLDLEDRPPEALEKVFHRLQNSGVVDRLQRVRIY